MVTFRKAVKSIIKSFIYGAFLLYVYNMFGYTINLVVPINIVTIFIAGFLGIPGLISLIIILAFNYR